MSSLTKRKKGKRIWAKLNFEESQRVLVKQNKISWMIEQKWGRIDNRERRFGKVETIELLSKVKIGHGWNLWTIYFPDNRKC